MENVPYRIYLQVGDECPADADFEDVSLQDVTWCQERVHKSDLCYVRSGKAEPKPASTNSAMDAILLIKEVAERMAQSQEEGQVITLCACHGLGARIIELAHQHQ